jgi:hypothetical protein
MARASLWHAFARVQLRVPLDAWDDRPIWARVLWTLEWLSPYYLALLFVALGLAHAHGTRLGVERTSPDWWMTSFFRRVSGAGWLTLPPLPCALAGLGARRNPALG